MIRGVILTRQGLEGKARSTSMVPELVKLLPPDLFRTCLARVCNAFSDHPIIYSVLKKGSAPLTDAAPHRSHVALVRM